MAELYNSELNDRNEVELLIDDQSDEDRVPDDHDGEERNQRGANRNYD